MSHTEEAGNMVKIRIKSFFALLVGLETIVVQLVQNFA